MVGIAPGAQLQEIEELNSRVNTAAVSRNEQDEAAKIQLKLLVILDLMEEQNKERNFFQAVEEDKLVRMQETITQQLDARLVLEVAKEKPNSAVAENTYIAPELLEQISANQRQVSLAVEAKNIKRGRAERNATEIDTSEMFMDIETQIFELELETLMNISSSEVVTSFKDLEKRHSPERLTENSTAFLATGNRDALQNVAVENFYRKAQLFIELKDKYESPRDAYQEAKEISQAELQENIIENTRQLIRTAYLNNSDREQINEITANARDALLSTTDMNRQNIDRTIQSFRKIKYEVEEKLRPNDGTLNFNLEVSNLSEQLSNFLVDINIEMAQEVGELQSIGNSEISTQVMQAMGAEISNIKSQIGSGNRMSAEQLKSMQKGVVDRINNIVDTTTLNLKSQAQDRENPLQLLESMDAGRITAQMTRLSKEFKEGVYNALGQEGKQANKAQLAPEQEFALAGMES